MTPEEFVRCWQTSDTLQEAVAKMSVWEGRLIAPRSAYLRYMIYCELGVRLKPLPSVVANDV
jgi:hypothetical protein